MNDRNISILYMTKLCLLPVKIILHMIENSETSSLFNISHTYFISDLLQGLQALPVLPYSVWIEYYITIPQVYMRNAIKAYNNKTILQSLLFWQQVQLVLHEIALLCQEILNNQRRIMTIHRDVCIVYVLEYMKEKLVLHVSSTA